jgi:hypothetical protein
VRLGASETLKLGQAFRLGGGSFRADPLGPDTRGADPLRADLAAPLGSGPLLGGGLGANVLRAAGSLGGDDLADPPPDAYPLGGDLFLRAAFT